MLKACLATAHAQSAGNCKGRSQFSAIVAEGGHKTVAHHRQKRIPIPTLNCGLWLMPG
jgi:hypothetical protein